MRRFRRGQRVVLRAAVKRNRRHRYGPVRLRKGTSGVVVQRHSKLLKPPRYDIDFNRGRKRVRRVPAASLRRRRDPFLVLMLVLAVLLLVGYLTQYG